MRLSVWAPAEVVLTEEVTKVKAEAENGWFCVLPRHVDFVTSVVPGLLIFELPDRTSQYLAIDFGVMVKCGANLSLSTRNAVRGADLGVLKQTIETHFLALREKEKATRAFEAKLEGELVRQLLQVEKYARV
jgi:F-type H+-transporting ATPase subunit epsilon